MKAASVSARWTGLRLPRGEAWLSLTTVVVLLVLVGLPLVYVLLQALFPNLVDGDFSQMFSPVARVLAEPRLLGLVGNTVLLGVSVVLGCLMLALPLGALRGLTRVPGGAFWDLLFLVPFMIPPYIAALAWMMSLQAGGYTWQLFGVDAEGLLFSFTGVVLVMVLNVFPVVYFAVSRTLMAVGGRYASVGRVCGAGPWTAFFRLTLPLSIPGLAGSLLLVFALTIEEFGTPATLGAQAGVDVLVTGIQERFADWPLDIPGAAALSLVLVLLAMAAFYAQNWVVSRHDYVSVSGKPVDQEPIELGPWRWPVLALFALVGLVSVVIPMLAVLASALTGTLSGGLAWDNVSGRHFQALWDNSGGALQALGTSLGMATATALVTGVIGALVGYLVVRTATPGRRLLDVLSLLPNTLPGVVVAVGLILAWNQSPLYGSSLMLLLAYSCLLLPYPVRYASAAFRQMSDSLEHAARVSGAGMVTTFLTVLLPPLLPSLLVAMLLVFAIASRELVASLMVAPAGTSTVSTFVFSQFEQGAPGVGMAMSVVAILTTTLLLVALTVLSRNRLPIAG